VADILRDFSGYVLVTECSLIAIINLLNFIKFYQKILIYIKFFISVGLPIALP